MIHNLDYEDFCAISDSITVMKKSAELLSTFENNLVLEKLTKKLKEQATALTKTIGFEPTACREKLSDGVGADFKGKAESAGESIKRA